MTRGAYRCLDCGAAIPLSRSQPRGTDIKCPECGAWSALPPPAVMHERETYSRREHGAGFWVMVTLGGVALMVILVCGGIVGFYWFVYRLQQSEPVIHQVDTGPKFGPPTQFPPETEDYAAARKKFKTKLIREEPAPQKWDILKLPAGVTEMEYTSGSLRLKAWVSRDPASSLPSGGEGPGVRGRGSEKKPGVLFLHGGFAFDQGDWNQCKPFRDAGYVVMTPILRGENGQPGSYSMFYNEVDDVLAAAEAFAKLPHVDPQRMYVAGHSVGGTLALLAAMTSPRFRAAASFSGSPDQPHWVVGQWHLVPFDRGAIDDFEVDGSNVQKEYQMRSPLAFPGSFKCPTRLYFGSDEEIFRASSQLTAILAKKKNLDVEALQIPGDHMSSVEPAMQQCIEFFRGH